MTITMTEKHQITIPKRVAEVMGLGKGSLFRVEIYRNRLELIPVEMKEKTLSEKQYEKLDELRRKEKGEEVRVTKELISRLKKGKV